MKKGENRLVGGCERCGWCCKNVVVSYGDTHPNREWVSARGFRVVQSECGVIQVEIPSVCPEYDEVEGCGLHGKSDGWGNDRKPIVCREFPLGVIGVDPKAGLTAENFVKLSKGWEVESG